MKKGKGIMRADGGFISVCNVARGWDSVVWLLLCGQRNCKRQATQRLTEGLESLVDGVWKLEAGENGSAGGGRISATMVQNYQRKRAIKSKLSLLAIHVTAARGDATAALI